MLNQVLLMGRLAADPEVKQFGEEGILAALRLAVERDYKNKNGEKEVDFIPCKAFSNTAKFVRDYYHKGDLVVVSGRWTVETYIKDDTQRSNHVLIVKETYPAQLKKRTGPDQEQTAVDQDGFVDAESDPNMPFE